LHLEQLTTSDNAGRSIWSFVVMINEFGFEPRLGKIGHRKSARPKPFVRQVMDVA
jgi:hypothetical protein